MTGDAEPAKAHRYRLAGDHRLKRAADFRRVFADPVRCADRYFTVLARLQPPGVVSSDTRPADGSPGRLGLAISRKCAPRAVDRNRIKRLIRESFRGDPTRRLPIDVVVMCRPAARNADNAALLQALQRHWGHLRDRLCARSSG